MSQFCGTVPCHLKEKGLRGQKEKVLIPTNGEAQISVKTAQILKPRPALESIAYQQETSKDNTGKPYLREGTELMFQLVCLLSPGL